MQNVANWRYDESQYKNHQNNYNLIPEGTYRVSIIKAEPTRFKNGNEGFKIELAVNESKYKLLYYMSFDYNDVQKTNQRIGEFFNSFGITDYDLARYMYWVGHVGMVHIKHKIWAGRTYANVVYCVSRKIQVKINQTAQESQTDSQSGYIACPK